MIKKEVKILSVEDNPDDQEIIKLAFEKNQNIAKNRVIFAKDGAEAFEYLFNKKDDEPADNPILILLDLNLPKIDGVELLRRIRTDPKTKNIPVAVLSSSERKIDWIDTHSFGIDCFIHKTADFDKFVEAAGWVLREAVEHNKMYNFQNEY